MKRGRPPKSVAIVRRAEASPAASEVRGVDTDDPRIEELTARVREVEAGLYRDMIDRALQVGQLLRGGKKLLREAYPRWVREVLQISRPTANHYESVDRLAREEPGQFEKCRGLGPGKVYRLARISSDGRHKILRLPDLAKMNDARFATLTEPYMPVKQRKVTGNMRARGHTNRYRAVADSLEGATVPAGVEPEAKAAMIAELERVAKAARALVLALRGR